MGISHPMQKAMQSRIRVLLNIIKDAANGISEKELMVIFLVNGWGEPKLVKKYLTYLEAYGQIAHRDGKYYFKELSKEDSAGTTG